MRRQKQSGATIVEFALVLTIFLTFFLGILDFARMLWTWNAANEATRWGARVSVVCDKGATAVLASMKKFVPQLTAANVKIDWYDATGSVSATCDHTNCAGVSVQIINLDYQWISPIGFGNHAPIPMPGFSTYLPREVMGQDPNSAAVCS
ncbi:MAG TPA: TadE/TadG family type IV pilus assembly protein [Paucimonas sp.]|nr:TadE/TadG family type IV pilus assembly protein [Paucimonas sp.]